MFRYAIRIYHYFNQMPVGILIMADTSNTFRPTQYRYTEPHTGLTTTYEFLLFKTADWRDRIDQIKESKDLVDQVYVIKLLSRKFGLTQEESNMIKECQDRSL